MPTYQYACTECEHRFEAFQSFSDNALTECPECSGKLRKLFGSVGIVFKGSGFYRTDSRSGSSSTVGASSDSSSSSSDSKSTSTSDASKSTSSSSTTTTTTKAAAAS
ncbi:FmdB family zinc ribbon protein [Allokutzneria albata]|uniref:Putative regulatory protein, FmdB family n=1 Tax=Allokutzneria albata TaxID=211114 RepID=A0A1H0B4A7_ALLAB|nr:FmdB family zinc ribbon protein [Allokutzneria albata]SDN40507.1 putative regulatory protein, FmdB family [Allokutzneria albata]